MHSKIQLKNTESVFKAIQADFYFYFGQNLLGIMCRCTYLNEHVCVLFMHRQNMWDILKNWKQALYFPALVALTTKALSEKKQLLGNLVWNSFSYPSST